MKLLITLCCIILSPIGCLSAACPNEDNTATPLVYALATAPYGSDHLMKGKAEVFFLQSLQLEEKGVNKAQLILHEFQNIHGKGNWPKEVKKAFLKKSHHLGLVMQALLIARRFGLQTKYWGLAI